MYCASTQVVAPPSNSRNRWSSSPLQKQNFKVPLLYVLLHIVFQLMAILYKGEDDVFRGVTGKFCRVHFVSGLAFCQGIHRHRDERGRTEEHNGEFFGNNSRINTSLVSSDLDGTLWSDQTD